jgi:hypothetical protein
MSPMSPRLLRPRTAFDPRNISSLAGWWDASDASTVTLNGSSVSQLNDKSGLARNASQGTAANQPTTTTINGKTAMLFDGSNDHLLLGAGLFSFAHTDSFSIVAVAKRTSDSGIGCILGKQESSGNARGYALTVFSTASTPSNVLGLQLRNASAAQAWRNSAWTFGQDPVIVSSVYSGTGTVAGMTLKQNGSERTYSTQSDTLAGNTIANAVNACIGSRQTGNLSFNGSIGEIIVYAKALSSGEVSRLERYLAAKWGVTLS